MVIPPFPALLPSTFGNVVGFSKFLGNLSPVIEAVLRDQFCDGFILLGEPISTSKDQDCLFICYNFIFIKNLGTSTNNLNLTIKFNQIAIKIISKDHIK